MLKLRRCIATSADQLDHFLYKSGYDLNNSSNKDIVDYTENLKQQPLKVPTCAANVLHNQRVLACRGGCYIEPYDVDNFTENISRLVNNPSVNNYHMYNFYQKHQIRTYGYEWVNQEKQQKEQQKFMERTMKNDSSSTPPMPPMIRHESG
jgi:hypothetical protein